MSDTETALLLGVRDRIREACGYSEAQCECEFDEMAPASVGDVYVVVMPGGWQPGPRNNGGGILDELIDVEVEVILRSGQFPKDRSRGLFMDTLTGLNTRLQQINTLAGHLNYAVLDLAKLHLVDSTQGFVEPLKFGGIERKPREVPPEIFSATAGSQPAGLARRLTLVGARRIQNRTTMT